MGVWPGQGDTLALNTLASSVEVPPLQSGLRCVSEGLERHVQRQWECAPAKVFFFFITLEPRVIQPSMSLKYEGLERHVQRQWECGQGALLLFFFTLVTGPRRSLSLKLSDTRVY